MVVIIPAADPHAPASAAMLVIITLCCMLLLLSVWLGRVYRKLYLALLESAFIANLGLFAAVSLYLDDTNGSQSTAVYVLVGMVFIVFVCIVGYQLVQCIERGCCCRKKEYMNLQQSLPDGDRDERQ